LAIIFIHYALSIAYIQKYAVVMSIYPCNFTVLIKEFYLFGLEIEQFALEQALSSLKFKLKIDYI
jgi:hypothetical protein